MNLYRISQKHNTGWDTYDSAVVAAPDETTAKRIYLSCVGWIKENPVNFIDDIRFHAESDWVTNPNPNLVNCQFLGTAKEGTEIGVICASFNAG